MIECRLERQVFTFDGLVIHRLHPSGIAMHFYIDFVESAEIASDKKGRQYLQINMKEGINNSLGHWPRPDLSPDTIPQAQAFVDEVMRAIGSREANPWQGRR